MLDGAARLQKVLGLCLLESWTQHLTIHQPPSPLPPPNALNGAWMKWLINVPVHKKINSQIGVLLERDRGGVFLILVDRKRQNNTGI